VATGSKTPSKTRVRRPLSLTILNILLVLCLGFVGFYTIQKVRNTEHKPETEPHITAEPVTALTDSEIESPPFTNYQAIWKRNLFKTSQKNVLTSEKKIAAENLALAGKDLGLKLIGTVLADDPQISLAVIENLKTKLQDGYREGDKSGEVLIKKVLRNAVVITTEQGDMLLSVEERKPFESVTASKGSKFPVSRTTSTRLRRKEVKASQTDIEQLLKEKLISPYVFKDKTYGFRIDKVPAPSVLRKMGLESQDIILGVNGRATTNPSQAADYFRALDKSGEASITVLRQRRNRIIHYNIE